MVDVGANGRISDGGVLYYTKFWEKFVNNTLNIPLPSCLPNTNKTYPYVFVANEAFSLKCNLMKPFSQHELTNDRRIFNYRLSRARRVVENAFGVLASKFGVFQKPINLSPEKAVKITMACCYLHNFLIETNQQLYRTRSILVEENLETGGSLKKTPTRNAREDAKLVKEKYCNYFNKEGQVPWQTNMI